MADPEQTARQRLDAELDRLEQLRDEVAARIADEQAGDSAELSHLDQHPAELGTETQQREQDQSLLEQLQGELADLEDAYAHLDAGTYGRCEVCGRPIGEERLQAIPAARRCADHQAAAEAGDGLVS